MAQRTAGFQMQILFHAHLPAIAVDLVQCYSTSGNTHINRNSTSHHTKSSESRRFTSYRKKDIDNQCYYWRLCVLPSLLAQYCQNRPNNRHTVSDQQVVRKQRRLELLLMEQNCVEWVLAV